MGPLALPLQPPPARGRALWQRCLGLLHLDASLLWRGGDYEHVVPKRAAVQVAGVLAPGVVVIDDQDWRRAFVWQGMGFGCWTAAARCAPALP
jgi:hypothetical protein